MREGREEAVRAVTEAGVESGLKPHSQSRTAPPSFCLFSDPTIEGHVTRGDDMHIREGLIRHSLVWEQKVVTEQPWRNRSSVASHCLPCDSSFERLLKPMQVEQRERLQTIFISRQSSHRCDSSLVLALFDRRLSWTPIFREDSLQESYKTPAYE